MLKKTIQFKTFDGETVTDDFYFHLSKAELTKMELSHGDGFAEYLQAIVASEDGKAIVENLEEIILMSYGQRSIDGRRFIKNHELREDFHSTDAFSELFMEIALNASAAAEFINGIVPSDVLEGITASDVKAPELPTAPAVTAPHAAATTGTNEVDFDSLLAEMNQEEPKKQITQQQYDFMKSKLNEEQLALFMSTRVVS